MTRSTRSLISSAVLAVLLVFSAGCHTVPETGRLQFNAMSSSEEMQLGLKSFDKLKKDVPISKDATATALVQKVGKRIAAVAPLPDAQWEFVLFESKEANAFCLPGGKVGVYTGLLPITRNEAGLATVIGHEVAHAVARHGGERITTDIGLQLLGQGVSYATAESKYQAAAVQVYGLGSQLAVALPYSRLQESEADRIGLLYMARAGYDPQEAVFFWERFSDYDKQGGDTTPYLFRTHPVNKDRIADLQKWLPNAKAQYRPNP